MGFARLISRTIIHAQKVHETESGRVWRTLACENCPCKYGYWLERQVTAESNSYFGLNKEARGVAAQAARAGIERAMTYAEDPVPCPKCGWLPQRWVGRIKRSRCFALLAAFVVVVAIVLVIAAQERKFAEHAGLAILLITVIFVVAIFFALLPDLNSAPRRQQRDCRRGIPLADLPSPAQVEVAQLFRSQPLAEGLAEHKCEYCQWRFQYDSKCAGGLVECPRCGEMCDIP